MYEYQKILGQEIQLVDNDQVRFLLKNGYSYQNENEIFYQNKNQINDE